MFYSSGWTGRYITRQKFRDWFLVDWKGRVDIISGPTIWRPLPHPSASCKIFKFRRSPLFIEGFPLFFKWNIFFGGNQNAFKHAECSCWQEFSKCWQRFETSVNFQSFYLIPKSYPNSADCSISMKFFQMRGKGFFVQNRTGDFFCKWMQLPSYNWCDWKGFAGISNFLLLTLKFWCFQNKIRYRQISEYLTILFASICSFESFPYTAPVRRAPPHTAWKVRVHFSRSYWPGRTKPIRCLCRWLHLGTYTTVVKVDSRPLPLVFSPPFGSGVAASTLTTVYFFVFSVGKWNWPWGCKKRLTWNHGNLKRPKTPPPQCHNFCFWLK